MLINTLEQMEIIVSNNDKLSWNGWDVVERTKSESGFTSISGRFINGSWYIEKTYSINRSGWEIPNRYGK